MSNKIQALFLFLSLAGLAMMYLMAGNVEAKAYSIAGISAELTGRYVEVTGYVDSVSFSDSAIFVRLSDGYNAVDIIIFSDIKNAIGESVHEIFSKGSAVSVKGVVDEYKGRLEIIPGRVSDIKKLV